MNWKIPLSDIDFDDKEISAVNKVIASKWLTMGDVTKNFEDEFSSYVGTKHAIAVANGTAALHLCLLGLGFSEGDEIIQPALNFVAASNMTHAVGATPIFADIIGLNEPTICAKDIENRITKRTKCLLIMHYGGYPCRMDEIKDICHKYNLVLIEDACHAVGARYQNAQRRPPNGKMVGNLGDAACFSFFSNKNLVTGEGGMIVTNRDDLAEKIRLLRSHGMTSLTLDRHKGHASSYDVIMHGYNYRSDELKSALGIVQLKKLKKNNILREKLVYKYRKCLKKLAGWTIPFYDYSGSSSYHLMVALAPDEMKRNQIVKSLRKQKIQTSLHYPCLSEFKVYNNSVTVGIENSYLFAKRAITLPLYPTMTSNDVETICSVISNH